MTRSCVLLVTLCGLLALATSAHAKSEIWLTGTFSSLRFNTEGGDLLGVELTIVPTRKGYQGALQIAEGGHVREVHAVLARNYPDIARLYDPTAVRTSSQVAVFLGRAMAALDPGSGRA